MRARETLGQVVRFAAGRPRLTILAVVCVAIACGLVSLGLSPATGISTFVGTGSHDYKSTLADSQQFGGDAVVVLVRQKLQNLLASEPSNGTRWDLGVLSELEGCLNGHQISLNSGQTALEQVSGPKETPIGGRQSPCGQLMRHRPAKVVYGPATFLNQAVIAVDHGISEVTSEAAATVKAKGAAARKLALARGLTTAQANAAANAAEQLASNAEYSQLEQEALQYGLTGPVAITDAQFISSIVFDSTRGAYTPKARLSYLFPTSSSALIQVRLRSGLTSAQTAQAIAWIRAAVRMPVFRLGYGGSYVVSGEPVVLNDLATSITGQVSVLLVAAVLVMALVLVLVFRGRLRLLPLALALAAAAITFGLTALAGAELTMASIAVLPILIGLAVDYAIQFQSRAREGGLEHAAKAGAPTIAAAALATATGFLVLLTSPVPMVRGFGLLLVVGVGVAFVLTLTAGAAALTLAGGYNSLPGGDGALRGDGSPMRVERTSAVGEKSTRIPGGAALVASLRGAGELLRDAAAAAVDALRRAGERIRVPRLPRSPLPRLPLDRLPTLEGALWTLSRRPGRVLAIGLTLALAGWVADTQTAVQSDVTKLVPANMPALKQLDTLEHVTGMSGEIDVVLHGRNVATPATVNWMLAYETKVEHHFHYVETTGCQKATLCPALSLTDLFEGGSGSSSGTSSSTSLTQAAVSGLLGAVPSYFSQAVITPDRRYAALAFGLRLMPLSRQEQVVAYLRTSLHPPPGVTASLAGLSVLAADANQSLSSASRRLLMLVLGIVAVGLVLLAVFRNRRRALVPLVPIVLATGWSALIVFLLGIPLNPMSATLGALVIAISTEFSVLLAERFGQERTAGHDPDVALERAYRSTGRAVVASGVTAIAGFGVLVISNITMLRDFGFVTIVDMTVSLCGVLAVLPATLLAVERGNFAEWWWSAGDRLRNWRPRAAVLRRRGATAA